MAHAAGSVLHEAAVDWLRLIRSEYLEMPGLHLTLAQARRLWRLDPSTSSAVLDALVEAGSCAARIVARTFAPTRSDRDRGSHEGGERDE